MWKQGLPISEMDPKMTMSLKELSQVLAVVGILIFSSQEEHILTVVNNLSTSLEVIKEPKPHEPHSEDNLQASTDHFFQTNMEDEDSCTTFEGDKSLEPESEEFTTCLLAALVCTQETTHPKEDNLYGMVEEDVQHCLNE